MAKNLAVRRAAKAQRRKAVVAVKRKAELETGSPGGQVRLAAKTPIQHCLISRDLFSAGMGTLVLARGTTPYNVTTAVFLLDTFALGAKDVFIRSLSGREFADTLERMSEVTPMMPVEPSYARKLLHDLVAWSRTIRVAPHRDYAKVEPLFGAIDPTACDTAFAFGFNGKPLFVGDLSGVPLELDDDSDDDDEDDFLIEGEIEASPDAQSADHRGKAD